MSLSPMGPRSPSYQRPNLGVAPSPGTVLHAPRPEAEVGGAVLDARRPPGRRAVLRVRFGPRAYSYTSKLY